MQQLPAVANISKQEYFFMRRLIRRGAVTQFTSSCVCVCLCASFLVVVGVGCWNKAALCLVNLSHKCQLAGRLCNPSRDVHMQYMLHMATLSHPHTHPHLPVSPGALYSDSTGPTHSHTQRQIECGEESEDKMGCNTRLREIIAPIFTSLS